jgi:hypothetical protein
MAQSFNWLLSSEGTNSLELTPEQAAVVAEVDEYLHTAFFYGVDNPDLTQMEMYDSSQMSNENRIKIRHVFRLVTAAVLKSMDWAPVPVIDPWHEFSTPYSNGWEPNADTPWDRLKYRKDPAGNVHIHGAIKSGTLDTAAVQLPEGYRPNYGTTLLVVNGRVEVTYDGQLRVLTPSSTTWLPICISFPAAT